MTIPRMIGGLFQPHHHFEVVWKERTARDERAPDVKVLVVEHLMISVLTHVENNCRSHVDLKVFEQGLISM